MNTNDNLLFIIKNQFSSILNDNENYKDVKLYIANEQQFVKEKNREKGAIYIVVKFLSGSVNFGQQLIPIQFNVLSEQNKIEICQSLLMDYVTTYNLTMANENTIKQFYSTPSVSQAFNDIFDGFRTTFFLSGSFIISENSLNCDVMYQGEKIEAISVAINFSVNLDTQAFYNTKNFTKSLALTGTRVLTIAMYLVDTPIVNDCLKMLRDDKSINNDFALDLYFKNKIAITGLKFKLVNFATQENVGEIPVVSMTFTN